MHKDKLTSVDSTHLFSLTSSITLPFALLESWSSGQHFEVTINGKTSITNYWNNIIMQRIPPSIRVQSTRRDWLRPRNHRVNRGNYTSTRHNRFVYFVSIYLHCLLVGNVTTHSLISILFRRQSTVLEQLFPSFGLLLLNGMEMHSNTLSIVLNRYTILA